MAKFSSKLLSRLGFQIEPEGFGIDLVCGMEIEVSTTKFKTKYKGKKYYFCSDNCLHHFEDDPEKYAG